MLLAAMLLAAFRRASATMPPFREYALMQAAAPICQRTAYDTPHHAQPASPPLTRRRQRGRRIHALFSGHGRHAGAISRGLFLAAWTCTPTHYHDNYSSTRAGL